MGTPSKLIVGGPILSTGDRPPGYLCPESAIAGRVDHGHLPLKPPKEFKERKGRLLSYSLCMGCRLWKRNNIFHHEGIHWVLCRLDYADYWENTYTLLADYKGY